MSNKAEKVQVVIKYRDHKEEIIAEPQQAWLLINRFFENLIPTFQIAQKLFLAVDLQQLATDLTSIITFTGEGANLLIPKNKLTDNEALSLWLTACYLGDKLGVLNGDGLTKDELQIKLGKTSKITSTRLGELVKSGLVQKTANEKYKITTFGVSQTQKELIPKIKQKLTS